MSRKGPAIVGAFALAAAAAAATVPAHGAGPQRYANALTPLLDAADGKPVGALGPGAAVEVLGQSGDVTQVAVHGWIAQGPDSTVLAAPDRPVAVVSGFTGKGAEGGSQVVGGLTYRAVTIEGWTATSALAADLQTVWTSAASLYAKHCASCHALPNPATYSAGQWPEIMKTQAGYAGLDPNQTALLTSYLQAHGRR
jgi:hypothetical protein